MSTYYVYTDSLHGKVFNINLTNEKIKAQTFDNRTFMWHEFVGRQSSYVHVKFIRSFSSIHEARKFVQSAVKFITNDQKVKLVS